MDKTFFSTQVYKAAGTSGGILFGSSFAFYLLGKVWVLGLGYSVFCLIFFTERPLIYLLKRSRTLATLFILALMASFFTPIVFQYFSSQLTVLKMVLMSSLNGGIIFVMFYTFYTPQKLESLGWKDLGKGRE